MYIVDGFSGWAALDGYAEHVEEATAELEDLKGEIFAGINPESIRGSLEHPNGFLVNTLGNSSDGQLRLHIWPTGRVDDLTPHSHPWHMVSVVLAGVYTEHIPEVRLDTNGTHDLMGPIYDEDRRQIGNGPTGHRVTFELGKLMTYGAGEYHCLPAGEYHATPLPVEAPFVTLVKTGPQLYDNPTYLLRELNRELQLSTAPDRKPPTEEEVRRVWTELIPVLEAVTAT